MAIISTNFSLLADEFREHTHPMYFSMEAAQQCIAAIRYDGARHSLGEDSIAFGVIEYFARHHFGTMFSSPTDDVAVAFWQIASAALLRFGNTRRLGFVGFTDFPLAVRSDGVKVPRAQLNWQFGRVSIPNEVSEPLEWQGQLQLKSCRKTRLRRDERELAGKIAYQTT